MRARRRIGGVVFTLAVTAIGTGLGAHRWGIHHVEYYTGDVARTTNCVSCHFDARGGTLIDRIRRPRYRTPTDLAVCPDDGLLYVTARDAGGLLVVDPSARRVIREIDVGVRPHGVVLSRDCRLAYVSDAGADEVAVVDLRRGERVGTLPAGSSPAGLALDRDGRRLYVANWAGDDISVIDLETGREAARLIAGENPVAIAPSPGGGTLLVANQIAFPTRRPGLPVSELTLIDASRARVAARHRVVNAHLLEGVAFAPEGDLALVTLIRPKNLLPALQVERGWMMTSAIAVLDLRRGRIAQLPLDEVDRFYADPAGVAITPDGRLALVAHGGVDTVTVIDLPALRALIRDRDPAALARYANDLGISRRFVRARVPTGTNPRALALSPDGRHAYVAERLDDRIGVIDLDRLERTHAIDLGGPSHITLLRRGERLFHSAEVTLEQQFSCRSCHPRSRVDGLQYDFEPDGLGRNIVDNRSLLGLARTGPFKWNGKNTSLYMQCGVRFARFLTRSEPFSPRDLNALVAYIASLEAPRGRRVLTPAERRGKEIFERSETRDGRPIPNANRCPTCHVPPSYTNGRRADVGSGSPEDSAGEFDVPHLTNLAETAPYLHDGKALTLEEIWTLYSPEDTHGVTSDLGKEGLNDLILYLRTL
ncbi:MAG: hypothetical protein ACE5JH_04265 [Acidobacteriota bacterium]